MDIAQTQRPDGGYLQGMKELSLIVDQRGLTLQKTLSRKSSQRNDRGATADDGAAILPSSAAASSGAAAFPGGGGAATVEVAADTFVVVEVPPVVAATGSGAAISASPQGRRAHGRRASSWLHPRNVLVFFATLSSVGTILLLYFTLAMGKMGHGYTDSR